jgi:hypothetical protein
MSNPNVIEETKVSRARYSPTCDISRTRETPMAMALSSLKTLREEAAHCRTCPLWKDATQTVFGEGPPHAPAMLVGE